MRTMQKEIWKDVIEYEGLYQVSNFGNVKSLSRKVLLTNKVGIRQTRVASEKIINKAESNNGYLRAFLSKNAATKPISIHRLVAIAFIPNPENKPQVNHIDGNKKNNSVDNLEWVTKSENQLHAYRNKLNIPSSGKNDSSSKSVYMFGLDGNFLRAYGSLCEAERNGFPRTCVTRVCRNKRII